MTEKQKEKYEKGLFDIGLKAVLKHPKAKLWAGANCADNFYWAVRNIIHDAIMDDIILLLDDDDAEWLNEACKNNEKNFKKLILKIAAEAYKKLR